MSEIRKAFSEVLMDFVESMVIFVRNKQFFEKVTGRIFLFSCQFINLMFDMCLVQSKVS